MSLQVDGGFAVGASSFSRQAPHRRRLSRATYLPKLSAPFIAHAVGVLRLRLSQFAVMPCYVDEAALNFWVICEASAFQILAGSFAKVPSFGPSKQFIRGG